MHDFSNPVAVAPSAPPPPTTLFMLTFLSFSSFSSLSPFLPSQPPRTPACCLRHLLLRAVLTHQRTPPLTCRLRHQPTPTQVRSQLTETQHTNTHLLIRLSSWSFVFPSLSFRAHITWGFSASPGPRYRAAEHGSEPGPVLGQTTVSSRQLLTNKRREEGRGHINIVLRKQYLKMGFKEAQVWAAGAPWWVEDPKKY